MKTHTTHQSSQAVIVENVSKEFFQQKQKTLKEFLQAALFREKTRDHFNALRNISFEVAKGETVGIIGKNGSGKSTILKLLAGVSEPSSGKITVQGRIAPLIELGAGFHPELSGRENVYLNGVILGLSRREVAEVFNEIVDFAEIREFIDEPVKHYSSGMYLRLAFAVAVHTKPDVLLVDEILAVGDEEFQRKCLRRMKDFQKSGVSIVLVSHNMDLIKSFCQRAIFINKNEIQAIGKPAEVVEKYQKHFSEVTG